MAIGATVRRAFGKHERKVSELWRAIFVDLDAWIAAVHDWAPGAKRILELGCGEGYSTERLAAAFPEARIKHLTPSQAGAMLRSVFGSAGTVSERGIRPWQNNYTFMVGPA